MERTIYDPIYPEVSEERRQELQETFGRHLVERRNRLAKLVRDWIETETKYPIPIYDRLLDRVRKLDPQTRSDIASITLLMADQIVESIIGVFDGGDYHRFDHMLCNYAVVAQLRHAGSHEIVEEVDINRGKPVIAIWAAYRRWLSRYAPSALRAASGGRASDEPRAD